ncbi:hypothetical protein MBLNU13_g08536t2 [Cladosporium sp. NU13]
MATPNSMATFKMEPNINYGKSPPLPTVSDTRQQIITNSLVIYPNVVQEHVNKFPDIPVRAADIFDVCIADVTKQYGGPGNPKYIAKLTHIHVKHPAARMLLESGSAAATIDGALHNLLEHSVSGLGVSHETLLPVRGGCAQQHTGLDAGWALHEDTTRKGLDYAAEVRQLATDFNMTNK